MLLGNIREDIHPNCRTSHSAPHLTSSFSMNNTIITPSTSSSTSTRTPITPQQTMMNYARMSYRYTTVRQNNLFILNYLFLIIDYITFYASTTRNNYFS